ncbi:MAG: DUF502 domain-containing protein [Armatimonadota bacterium]|nr:DUF502 domain-containing protein [Armatimonadota bacterium]MDR7438993.1 DUF502 domain-containing protein [Armatimonadota bacterium]MDR7563267.1 DUF502 domain-containing protein [Armatimonadota bacterium]MDR7566975.1 DUF502 domain-containing protein [Armatimonadota bacterium]MDR7602054.1 DUF502 domain-containing protein [Armatimonadota bacterium]
MARLRRILIAGLLTILPFWVTYTLLRWLFLTLDSGLQPLLRGLVGGAVPGAGLVVGLLLILAAGVAADTFVGQRAIGVLERLAIRTPLVRTVYGATKQIAEALVGNRPVPLRRVVLVEWPRRGAYIPAFVTGELHLPSGQRLLRVFVVSAPNPTTGFLMILPESETIPVSLTVDEGMTLVISGGLAGPADVVAEAIEAAKTGAEERGDDRT